ncbi:hypothetical protein G6F46_010166 [Rhizopus delemar]|nr:hypothetical protein G6F43_009554 [Rhizopus delemar]KAG1537725.1 hypothetical protein G6F51_010202 [Rhizopus arrhizus]KAG1447268.1 hypothetical protein G6F55_011182 [Rhizopus delemar]KAG1489432.1 hypothetical protein G6F54_011441 [Rhizopus delemar]KAG1499671.1 hypothetical protein G6F53_011468 [Rhizopus delemar]
MIQIDSINDIQSEDDLIDNPMFIILFHLSMNHYFPLFEESGINLEEYILMSEQDFKQIGIQDPGDLDLLSTCARALKVHLDRKQFKDHHHSPIIKKAIHAYTTNIPLKRPFKQTNNIRPLSMPVFLPSLTPPPHYEPESRKERCQSMMIIPREEEGREELPAYSCTVFKMGYVNMKKEFDAPNIRTRWRHWRKLYLELWGTILRIYRTAPPKHDTIPNYYPSWPFGVPYHYYHKYYHTPIFTLSLAGAEASRAFDYLKRPNVLRLTTQQGPQLLLRLSSHVEMISWIEHLQAAINISLDLEDRPMPKFITLPSRAFTSGLLDPRTVELERIREQRRRDQREILI